MSGTSSGVSIPGGQGAVEARVCQTVPPPPYVTPVTQFYDGAGGNTAAVNGTMPPVGSAPTAVEVASNGLRLPVVNFNGRADNYSARLAGYIVPTVSGAYTFYISSDDSGVFKLGPANGALSSAVSIAQNAGYSGAPGTGGATSAVVNLTAGVAYPFELTYSDGTGGDYAQVDWSGPVGARQVVPAAVLASTIPVSSTREVFRRTVIDSSGVVTYVYTLPDGTVVTPTAAQPIVSCPCCPSTATATALGSSTHTIISGIGSSVPAGLRSVTITKTNAPGTVTLSGYPLTNTGESVSLTGNDYDSANKTWSLPAIAVAATGGGTWKWVGVQ